MAKPRLSAKAAVLKKRPYAAVWLINATRPPRYVGSLSFFDKETPFRGTSARRIWEEMAEFLEGETDE